MRPRRRRHAPGCSGGSRLRPAPLPATGCRDDARHCCCAVPGGAPVPPPVAGRCYLVARVQPFEEKMRSCSCAGGEAGFFGLLGLVGPWVGDKNMLFWADLLYNYLVLF